MTAAPNFVDALPSPDAAQIQEAAASRSGSFAFRQIGEGSFEDALRSADARPERRDEGSSRSEDVGSRERDDRLNNPPNERASDRAKERSGNRAQRAERQRPERQRPERQRPERQRPERQRPTDDAHAQGPGVAADPAVAGGTPVVETPVETPTKLGPFHDDILARIDPGAAVPEATITEGLGALAHQHFASGADPDTTRPTLTVLNAPPDEGASSTPDVVLGDFLPTPVDSSFHVEAAESETSDIDATLVGPPVAIVDIAADLRTDTPSVAASNEVPARQESPRGGVEVEVRDGVRSQGERTMAFASPVEYSSLADGDDGANDPLIRPFQPTALQGFLAGPLTGETTIAQDVRPTTAYALPEANVPGLETNGIDLPTIAVSKSSDVGGDSDDTDGRGATTPDDADAARLEDALALEEEHGEEERVVGLIDMRV